LKLHQVVTTFTDEDSGGSVFTTSIEKPYRKQKRAPKGPRRVCATWDKELFVSRSEEAELSGADGQGRGKTIKTFMKK